MALEELERLEKELAEKIANREAMIVAYGDRMPKEKFEELSNWKEELVEVKNKVNQNSNDKGENQDNKSKETEPENDNQQEPGNEEDELSQGDGEPKNENSNENKLNIIIHKKTGEVTIDNGEIHQTFIMDSQFYKKKKLDLIHKNIADVMDLSEEDRKYIGNVDPTIYKAYYIYDSLKGISEKNLLSDEYVRTVIEREKAIEKGEKFKENPKLGNIKVDIGWHPRMKNKRDKKEQKFGLRNLMASFHANRILKKHGMSGRFFGKKMNLAQVLDNRGKFAGLTALFAAFGTSAYLGLSSGNSDKTNIQNSVDVENEYDKDKISEANYISTSQEKKEEVNIKNESVKSNEQFDKQNQTESQRFHFGQEVNVEKYSLLYTSSTAGEANGALTTNEKLGINKIACEIDGKVYSSKDYSFDEIYKMAEKAGVDVRYHVDQMKTIDGKDYVRVNDIYVYNDDGTFKTEDGEVWQGDVEYSSVAGWVNQKDVKNVENQKNNTTRMQNDDLER